MTTVLTEMRLSRCDSERFPLLMRLTLDPFRLLLIPLAGRVSQPQQDVIEYLLLENRVLHRK